jgi:hypothetical protein
MPSTAQSITLTFPLQGSGINSSLPAIAPDAAVFPAEYYDNSVWGVNATPGDVQAFQVGLSELICHVTGIPTDGYKTAKDLYLEFQCTAEALQKLRVIQLWVRRLGSYRDRMLGICEIDSEDVRRYAKWLNLARNIPHYQLEFDFVWLEMKGAGPGPDWVTTSGDVLEDDE